MVMYLLDLKEELNLKEEHGLCIRWGRRVQSCVGGSRMNKNRAKSTMRYFLKFLYHIAAEKIFPERH